MPFAPGAHLGRYEVIASIGSGGMGEVYQARDTLLNRLVAIKTLPSDHKTDADRGRRFEREAQAIAALAHPHICVLYDVGSHEGTDFLVMEYLEGETLGNRLLEGPLPIDDVLRYAAEIADALGAAHRHGIVHRDLKPANVMLTAGGAKLLDFGLARLRPAVTPGARKTPTAPETLTTRGTLLGTLPYMAPEQVQGAPGDERTDIFALGTVVYEMASGKRAFQEDSQASLIAAILDRQPEPLAGVQPALNRLVSKCLAKDPDARWQSARDLGDELRWIAGESSRPALSRARMLRWAAAAVVLLPVAAAGWWWRGALGSGASEVQHQQVTFSGEVVISALSPDGRTIASVEGVPGGDNRVLVREVGSDQALPVWAGRDLMALSWLPDGSHLATIAGGLDVGSVWIVPRLGGDARRVAQYRKMVAASPDGGALALTSEDLAGFSILTLADGATRVVKLTGFARTLAVDWHARTNRVVLMTGDDEEKIWSIWSVAADGRDQARLLTGDEYIRAICASPVSDVVYVMRQRAGSMDLLRVPIYPDPGGVRVLVAGLPITAMGYRCTVSADGGQLLYGRQTTLRNLWRLDVAPTNARATALTRGMRSFGHPAVSPDGHWIAATAGSEFDWKLVKMPIGGGEPVELGEGAGPAWSPDGQQVAFISRRSGSPRVWVAGANGQTPKEVKDSAVGLPPPAWLPDGRLAWQTPDLTNYRIRDLWTGREEYLLTGPAGDARYLHPKFSPRGDAIALERYRNGSALWVLSWPGRVERWLMPQVRPIGWSVDGEWIYAIANADASVVRVSSRTQAVERVGRFPAGLWPTLCDLTADRQAIVCGLTQEKSDAWIMRNFDPDLR